VCVSNRSDESWAHIASYRMFKEHDVLSSSESACLSDVTRCSMSIVSFHCVSRRVVHSRMLEEICVACFVESVRKFSECGRDRATLWVGVEAPAHAKPRVQR
jgi:hypothetical protein